MAVGRPGSIPDALVMLFANLENWGMEAPVQDGVWDAL
jgi:hypothetical protein